MATEYPRFPRERHPLCTCPTKRTLGGLTVVDVQPDCPGGTVAHPPPLTAEQLNQIIKEKANG